MMIVLAASASTRRFWSAEGVALTILLLVVCPLVIVGRAGHTTFFQDDFLNFEIYLEQGFHDPAYFSRSCVFGQIVPGYRLAAGLVSSALSGSIIRQLLRCSRWVRLQPSR